MELILNSQFANTYGGLSLRKDVDTGKLYLQMDDCLGPEVWGPLTDEQVTAFHTLCKVDSALHLQEIINKEK